MKVKERMKKAGVVNKTRKKEQNDFVKRKGKVMSFNRTMSACKRELKKLIEMVAVLK